MGASYHGGTLVEYLRYRSSSVDCIHTSLPTGRLRPALAAATSGPKPRAVMVKFLEYMVEVDGDSRSIMHSGGREKVVVMPARLTEETGRTRMLEVTVGAALSQLDAIIDVGVVVIAAWKCVAEMVTVLALGGTTTLNA